LNQYFLNIVIFLVTSSCNLNIAMAF